MNPARPEKNEDGRTTMAIISRDVPGAAESSFDLIVIGGGIYGVMLALEAGRRNKRSLLLEKDDFGGATSLNHLRTVHGGLRYLQSLDLPRFFESVAERRWFLTHFPALVQVLPCLMPLYGRGLKRPAIMRAALLLNDLLGLNRNSGVGEAKHLQRGRVVGRGFIRDAFPQVDAGGLQGGALWYDAAMPEHQRLLMELLRWACGQGATALNYVQAESLLLHHGRVRGVLARDRWGGQNVEFRAPVVINASGPGCRKLAQKFDRDYPDLFKQRLLLFNVLFKRKALSPYALALVPPDRPDHTYFVHNWQGRLLAGTSEIPLRPEDEDPRPRPEDIAAFVADMNHAVPGLSLSEKEIEHVYSGVLPATASFKLAGHEVILAHEERQGPAGLFSVSGVKFTTSRRVAEKTLQKVFPGSRPLPVSPPEAANSGRWFFDYEWQAPAHWDVDQLKPLVEEEAVLHVDDLLFRRTGLGENRERALNLLPRLRPLFPGSDLSWQQESERVRTQLDSRP
jgi:glycerol-3-phosphate dehydrogenase